MEFSRKYLQKNGVVLMRISREMMTYSVGDRIPTIAEYVERYQFSRGTIQAAIKFLCENGLKLDKMGHMGSYIAEIDYQKIWGYTGWGCLVGVMPLPLNDRLRAFTTAMTHCIQRSQIPFNLAFMQSASNRLRALEASRFDFAILSKLTAEICTKDHPSIETAVELMDKSYCKENVFAFANPQAKEIKDGMKIAYDPHSPDQKVLTLRFCEGKDVTLLEMPYRATLHSLEKGEVDAIIYRLESLQSNGRNFGISELPDPEFTRKGLQAVVITNKENYWIDKFLSKIIDPQLVNDLQEQVVSGEITSHY